jgi:hypothetical protein
VNAYTGSTTISAGILQFGDGTTGSIPGTNSVSGSTGAKLAFNLSSSGTFSKPITGGLGVTQAGTGTLTLTGSAAGNYDGLTSVTSSGTLNVSGNIKSGGAAVTGGGTLIASGGINGDVNLQGGTFGGMASINGNVIVGTPVASGSTSIFYRGITSGTTQQDPTDAPPVTGSLTLNSDAVFKFNINSSSIDPSTAADCLAVNGTLTLNNHPTLQLGRDLGSGQLPILTDGGDPAKFTFFFPIAYASGGIQGTFANLNQGDILQIGNNFFSIDYTFGNPDGTGINKWITLTVVPEPQTWAMMLGGLGVLGFWQRASRRRKFWSAA